MAVKMKGAWWYILPILLGWGVLKSKQPDATQPSAAFSEDVSFLERYEKRLLDFPYCHSALARSHKPFTGIQTYSSEQCGAYSRGNNFTFLILREAVLPTVIVRRAFDVNTANLDYRKITEAHCLSSKSVYVANAVLGRPRCYPVTLDHSNNFLNASLNYEYFSRTDKLNVTKNKFQEAGVFLTSDKEIVAISCAIGAAALGGLMSLLVFLYCRHQRRIRDQHNSFLRSIESPIPDVPIVDPLRALVQEQQNAIQTATINPEPSVQPAA